MNSGRLHKFTIKEKFTKAGTYFQALPLLMIRRPGSLFTNGID